MNELSERYLNVSYHDLTPHNQDLCQGFLEELKRVGLHCASLLVVPHWHRKEYLPDYPKFMHWLKQKEQEGHEICLHGYYHLADEVTGGPIQQCLGRIYTAREGEFFQLRYEQALERLEKGLQILHLADLTIDGFVSPAWLLGGEARKAIRDKGFLYTNTLMHMHLLAEGYPVYAPVLTFSCRTPLRRTCSKIWVRFWSHLQRNTPILRLAVHPADLRYRSIREQILSIAQKAAQYRSLYTYRELALLEMAKRKVPRLQNEKGIQINP